MLAFICAAAPYRLFQQGADRFGVSQTPGEQKAKPAPRSNSKASK
jgi:hypothetical protein